MGQRMSTDLHIWVARNMPRLDGMLSQAAHMDKCRRILQRATGARVHGWEPINSSSYRFLAALQAMSPAKRAYIELKAYCRTL